MKENKIVCNKKVLIINLHPNIEFMIRVIREFAADRVIILYRKLDIGIEQSIRYLKEALWPDIPLYFLEIEVKAFQKSGENRVREIIILESIFGGKISVIMTSSDNILTHIMARAVYREGKPPVECLMSIEETGETYDWKITRWEIFPKSKKMIYEEGARYSLAVFGNGATKWGSIVEYLRGHLGITDEAKDRSPQYLKETLSKEGYISKANKMPDGWYSLTEKGRSWAVDRNVMCSRYFFRHLNNQLDD